MDNEDWRDVVGYEGCYEVSNLGRIRSVDRVVTNRLGVTRKLKGRVLRVFPNSRSGHLQTNLCNAGVETVVAVHRVVLIAWVGDPPGSDYECCHNNGDPTDNRVCNLRWGTRSDNNNDAVKHGTWRNGYSGRND